MRQVLVSIAIFFHFSLPMIISSNSSYPLPYHVVHNVTHPSFPWSSIILFQCISDLRSLLCIFNSLFQCDLTMQLSIFNESLNIFIPCDLIQLTVHQYSLRTNYLMYRLTYFYRMFLSNSLNSSSWYSTIHSFQ